MGGCACVMFGVCVCGLGEWVRGGCLGKVEKSCVDGV